MRKGLGLFTGGFAQVFLISANTALIAHGVVWALFLVSFGISWVWSSNVRRISIGSLKERMIYCSGAAIASPAGYTLVIFLS